MVRAVGPAAEAIVDAMVAESQRQSFRALPVDLNDEVACVRRRWHTSPKADRAAAKISERSNGQSSHGFTAKVNLKRVPSLLYQIAKAIGTTSSRAAATRSSAQGTRRMAIRRCGGVHDRLAYVNSTPFLRLYHQPKPSITVVIFCWRICWISESMGHHDSEIMDDRSID